MNLIAKPFRKADLAKAVRQALAGRRTVNRPL